MVARTIASQIYPHLPSVESARPQRQPGDLASSMWPAQSRETREAGAERARRRESLLRHLDEALGERGR